ncbi:MAG: hypothetical protein AAFN91_10275 [Pseudomonadota bacterium]
MSGQVNDRVYSVIDASWCVMRKQGRFRDLRGVGPIPCARVDDLEMILITPFQRFPKTLDALSRLLQIDVAPLAEHTHSLTIWDRRRLVLSIQWTPGAGFPLLLKHDWGDWVNLLLRHGPQGPNPFGRLDAIEKEIRRG